METSQESKAQGWVSGHDAVEGPQGYFLGSLGVSPRHPNGPGMRCIDHDVGYLQTYKKTTEVLINFSSDFFNFSTLILTFNF